MRVARARAPRQALQDTFTLTNAQLQAELAVQTTEKKAGRQTGMAASQSEAYSDKLQE